MQEEWGLWDFLVCERTCHRPIVLVSFREEIGKWKETWLRDMMCLEPGVALPIAPVGKPIHILATKALD